MRSFLCAAALALAALPHLAQDVPATGFALETVPYPGGTTLSASTTLSNGDVIVFDGISVLQFESNGVLRRELATLDDFVFPSFVLADPEEERVYVGESTTGQIYRLFADIAGSIEPLAVLPLNYDAAMFDVSSLYVSTAACGFFCGNQIWRIDTATSDLQLVARTPGASGPLTFDGQGNLYYGTATDQFPPPPRPTSVYRWSAGQLLGPAVLDLDDAQLIGNGFSGAARLACDARTGAIYLAENNFASGENRIRRVLGSADDSPILLEGQTFLSIGSLTFHATPGPAAFRAFQPASGGALTYTTTDFFSTFDRRELHPRRPHLSVTGPGTSGPGIFTLTLRDGPPGGLARIYYCPSARYHDPERAYAVGGLPLFFGLDTSTLASVPGFLSLDASGSFQKSYFNAGGLQGRFALQLLLLDSDRHLVGSSDAGFL